MNSQGFLSVALSSVEAFTVVTLAVIALRPIYRHAFGANRAWQLWALPPLALLAAAASVMGLHAPVVRAPWFVALSGAARTPTVSGSIAPGVEWSDILTMGWLCGMALSGFVIATAQWRYRRAMTASQNLSPLYGTPVHRAMRNDIGPATVGAWRPSIVVPADFDLRYSAAERQLILAHEMMHVRRHDGIWLLVAHVTASLLWFNPLAWWALRAFRHDQELACDADVAALPSTDRVAYARAIVSVHERRSPALPVGNTWSYQHPLTERIAMLKKGRNGSFGQRAGYASLVVLACGLVATASVVAGPSAVPVAATSSGYQLSLVVKLREGIVASPIICLRGSSPGRISGGSNDKNGKPEWSMDFTATPIDPVSAKVEVHGSVRQANGMYASVFPTVRTKLGEPGTVDFFQLEGRPQITITTVAGCPVATKAA